MNTAQLILGTAGQAAKATVVLPWIIGGVVVVIALWIIAKA